MHNTSFGILLVVVCAAIEGFAQVCLKKFALATLGKFRWIALAILFFVVEAILYTGALQHLAVSIAYPAGALSFVSVALFSRWLLQETVDARRWVGLGFILVGCALVVQG